MSPELTEVKPEPVLPDPLTATDVQAAEYMVNLWFWGRDMAERLRQIEALQSFSHTPR